MTHPKVVISGASGFLGRHLCRHLSVQGFEVVALTRKPAHQSRLWTTLQVPSYYEIPDFPGAVCLHLAGENRAYEVARSFDEYREESLALLETLTKKGFAQIALASSAAVYGDREGVYVYEESETPRPTGDYGRLKLDLEKALLTVVPHGLILRFSNIYGPGMSSESLLGVLMIQIKRGDPNVAVRSLNSVRDYLWIEDACQAVRVLLSGRGQGIFNVSTGVGVSIPQLLEELRQTSGSQFGVDTSETSDFTQVFQLALSSKKLQSAYGWKPETSLREGLSQWFKEIT